MSSLFPRLLFAVLLLPSPGSSAAETVAISEFLADNVAGIQDEDSTRGDWIELTNRGTTPVDLTGWWLSDTASNKRKWIFPEAGIAPGGTLLVWADSKDRRVPGQPLHTNFSLSKDGEYLGLHRPDPVTGLPVLVDEFAPVFPPQVPDVSYGRLFTGVATPVLSAGAAGRYRVLANNATGQAQYSGTAYASGQVGTGMPGGWNVSPSFDDSTWTAASTGIGYDTTGTLLPLLGTTPSGNCQTALRNVNTSLLFRTVFNVPDAAAPAAWRLRMKYHDGYVAFINGRRIDARNFTGTPAYNSKADASSPNTTTTSWTETDIPPGTLVNGANVLAIQGLNRSAGSSDFLLLPEILAVSTPVPGPGIYFSPPTPRAPNKSGLPGPLLLTPSPADPAIPRPAGTASSPPLTVSVRGLTTGSGIASVKLFYRVMWAAESTVTLTSAAGDGLFTGTIPTSGVGPGQMLRWRFEAQDVEGHATRLPAFPDDDDSPRYFGTVAVNPATASSRLPVFEWFVENAPVKGPSGSEGRSACYYLNRFYDNIEHEGHGDTTGGFPKRSYNLDFNAGSRFIWKEGEIAAKDLNLLTNYADKTKMRNTISHEVGRMAGTPYHYSFPVRVQINGGFHAIMELMEDSDDHMLERNGLDPLGALYKLNNTLTSATSGVVKKTRKNEDNAELQALVDGLNPQKPLATRRAWAYDNLDLAATVNYMTVRQLNSDRDHGHKNYLLYRDTNNTREWQPIIWDVDLSQGHNFSSGLEYFDDQLVSKNPLNAHNTSNRLYNLILESPEFQEMWVRRMRTLMDTILQPPGTVNGLMETRMRELAALMDPDPAASTTSDSDLDAIKWGFPSSFAPNRPREEVERLVTGYFAPRREFLFDQSATRPLLKHPSLNNGIPLPNQPQTAGPGSVVVDSLDFYPPGPTQAGEYIVLKNTSTNAIDLSGWTLGGAVTYTFKPGTVLPAGPGTAAAGYKGLLHVVKDAAAFRARASGPRGGEMRFIQGNYDGQLSSRGESVELRDAAGTLINGYTYAGSPTLLQQWLRISELHYHPADASAAELAALPGVGTDDFEFIELLNTGTVPLTLDGATFTSGIAFTFPAATTLAAGERLLLVKNPAAFRVRYPAFAGRLAGPYEGRLENDGERLELTEASGEVVLDFSYRDGWYPATDGRGYSLVVRQPGTAAYDAYGNPLTWAISQNPGGSPGAGDSAFASAYRGWDNRYFTSAERNDVNISGPDADPDGDGRSNLEEYAFGTDPRAPDLPGMTVEWSGNRPSLRFQRPRYPIDLAWFLEACADARTGPWRAVPYETTVIPEGDLETVLMRESTPPAGAARRYYRVRCSLMP